MSGYYVEMEFTVTDYGTADHLSDHLDCVLDELHDDARVTDPDYTATLTSGDVEFGMEVPGADAADALRLALVAMRAAIHAAEGCTEGWEAHFEDRQQVVRKVELVDA